MSTQHPLSLGEVKRLAGSADTIRLRAVRDADLETPIGAFLRLDDGVTPAYLLESVEGGERLGRYSFLGIGPRRLLEVRGGTARIQDRPVGVVEYAPDLPVTELPVDDPLAALRAFVPRRTVEPTEGMPRFTGRRRRAPSPTTRSRSSSRPFPSRTPTRSASPRQLHRDRPRPRLRPPDPHAGGHRVAPHRRPAPGGALPGRRARPLRGPRADGPAQCRRDRGRASTRRARRHSAPRCPPRPRRRWAGRPTRPPSATRRTPSPPARRSRSSSPGASR